ncbi:phosphoglycolate phosphatase [Burkholderia dolosa]|jgi:phosphoglycolate phosphatase|uniref:phosphoglycolate phosphatase n=1 Tax=Burkholderia dolosa TaxID=152500 RepID=UPI001591406E|nr:phosphoglycolate phosphatase [Burkholderia dolosa]MBR8057045.1 phosphoglycolate phosphatase [Burkholderia dolosa]MBR8456845.1 phosphoglycolate phosphatase [Burkholderia dolosa]MBY4753196.1 phosphoglycolate phosphatase [Burkholderia dolosa]MDN7421026.1 phosphoglycolate phosphatase [Burkholderia dolosa]
MTTPLSPARAAFDAPRLQHCDAVLFDLDGTLADTAPDLAAAVHKMQRVRGLPQTPIDVLRPLASAGARGLLGGAFGIGPQSPDYDAMRDEFLANYATDLCVHTTLFPGIGDVLDELDARGVRWGIVTNKVMRLTAPLVELLGLASRAACVVGGDTTPHPKPHPAPLLHAAAQLTLAPQRVVYVGDDLRDIQAGTAAGMATVAAAYGYCGDGAAPADWQAQHLVATTRELRDLLRDVRL